MTTRDKPTRAAAERGAPESEDQAARARWLRKQHSRRAGMCGCVPYADRAQQPEPRGDDHAAELEHH